MATNIWFDKFGTSEIRSLHEDLLIEFIQMHGMDVIYLPRVLLSKSETMNEIVNSYHARGMMIEMIPTAYDSYEQNDMSMSVFGLMAMPNTSEWEVSRRRFKECVDESRLAFGDRPNEGDIFYAPKMEEFFVIKKVNKDDPTKSKDRWKLRCIKYDEANNTTIDTQDFVEEVGMVDHRMQNGFGEFDAADFLSKEIMQDQYAESDMTLDHSMSAEEIDAMLDRAEKEANRKINAERVNTINAGSASNLHIEDRMNTLLERDVK